MVDNLRCKDPSPAQPVPPTELNRRLGIQPPEGGSFIHNPQSHPTQAMQAPAQAFQGSI